MISINPYPAAAVAARHHAELEWPNECVGFILRSGEYVPLVNVAADPESHWDINPHDFAAYADEIECLIHSHCYESKSFRHRTHLLERGPSQADMILQQEWTCNFGLVVVIDKHAEDPVYWGPTIPRAPLIGRPFIFGIWDCMTMLRDWFFLNRDIDLPDYPRGIDQIEANQSLYVPNIQAWGFRVLDGFRDVQPGDVLLAQMGETATVTNHAGIYLESGELLHHLRGRLSGAEPVNVWRHQYTHACRYEGHP